MKLEECWYTNIRTTAENADPRIRYTGWLIDLVGRSDAYPDAEVIIGGYAIHCLMDDFGELISSEQYYIAGNDTDWLWEYAVVVDGRIDYHCTW